MRKADELRRARTILSVFVVWTLVFSGTIGLGASLIALGADQPIEPTGDWTVSSDFDLYGEARIEGNLVVQGLGTVLTVYDGGIIISQDYDDRHSITIGAGATLRLINSYIKVEINHFKPYLILPVTVSGSLYGENALLQFPGHVNVTGTLTLWDSEVMGMTDLRSIPLAEQNRLNDAPSFHIDGGTAYFYRTSVYDMYTHTLGFERTDPSLGFIYDFNVTGNSRVWLVDSYLSIDYNTGSRNHNVLWARDSAQVYAYNLTLDTGDVNPNRVSAIRTDPAPSTATVHILRWADVLCVDSAGVPIPGVTLAPTLVQTAAAPNFPDSGGADPPNHILNYLGRTAVTWKVTGPDGKALLPLPIERIDYNVNQTQPNSDYDGPYRITGTYGFNVTSVVFSFSPYPAMDPVDGTYEVILHFPDILPKPDLVVTDIQWAPDPSTEPATVCFNATILNQGNGGANEIYVLFYVDGQQLNNTPTLIDFLNASQSEVTPGASGPPVCAINLTGGMHSIRVVVDYENRIAEDPASGGDGNNDRTEQFYVIPLLPDYVLTSGDINFPPAAYIGNPVRIDITVLNDGNKVAPEDTVRVYIGDPELGMIGGGEAPLGFINISATNTTFVYHTFDKAGDYRVCAHVDYNNDVEEKFDDNNQACANVTVGHAPNLAVTVNDIGIGDPCTRTGESVRPQATVRNLGYIDAPAYTVNFLIDDMLVGTGNSAGLPANQSEVVVSTSLWTPADPGIYILKVKVDPAGAVQESSTADNEASRDILIFDSKMAATYTGLHTLDSDKEFDGNIDITGSLTITNAHVSFFQPHITEGRYCIEVSGIGSLRLEGSTLTSNYPLVIYVTDSATLTIIDSFIELDMNGTGGLYADGAAQIVIETSSLEGSTYATGQSVSMKGVDLLGTELFIETSSKSEIWDSDFIEITGLFLLSDDGNVNTVDFDIRNVTDFLTDSNLFDQLVFGGSQLVELTSVPLPDEWWLTVVTENAKIKVYWWLTVEMVDGTGSVLPDTAISNLTFETLNVVTLGWDLEVGSPHNFVGGLFVHRALSLEMQAYPIGGWVNSTYAITADVTVDTTMYWPDTEDSRGNWTGKVHSDMTIQLQFSGLTPDFSVTSVDFVGDIVTTGNDHPVNIELTIEATIYNSGNIAADDVEVFFYRGPQLIGWDSISVPAQGSAVASARWTPTSIGPVDILVIVDLNNTKAERNEDNNDFVARLNVFGWPNVDIGVADVHVIKPVENTLNTVIVTVRNIGTDTAYNVDVRLDDDEGGSDTITIPMIAMGGAVDAYLNYTPLTAGSHYINITVFSSNITIYETDYDWSNNFVSVIRDVLGRPDLQVGEIVVNAGMDVTIGSTFSVRVEVVNAGGSDAANFTVQLILNNVTYPGQMIDVFVSAGERKNITIVSQPVFVQDWHWMCALMDPDLVIDESNESNNDGCNDFFVVPPFGSISLSSPSVGATYSAGDGIYVSGWVQEDVSLEGIPNVEIVFRLETTDGTQVGMESYTVSVSSGSNIGMIAATFYMPSDVECDSEYILRAYTNESNIRDFTVQIGTEDCPAEIPFWVWLLIIIIIIVVIIVVAITAYIRYFGLGKLVECGECGAFIPEDSTSCPKCGVEFETETAKCSNCQAWIPLKVKKCPECGVEFATGEVEMEDYKAKMKMQYDEVRTRFKAEAESQLGKSLTEAEFESWWKTQPTFMTFDQWLKQEEDMRKMGSKPCPSCGTLNSVTATVCHKCGAVMVEEEKRRRPPARPPEEKPKAAVPAKAKAPEAAPPTAPEEAAAPPAAGAPPAAVKPVPKKTLPTVERPVPKKVIKKPVMEGRPAVVPKKVEKEEEEEEEETY
ncbi:MAG: hypothetical protein JSV43_01325 [Methanobacteriota archaeon]|nr:MAG: hypothetical protein JSV43_01325 [Euryarchaeota archaeon]